MDDVFWWVVVCLTCVLLMSTVQSALCRHKTARLQRQQAQERESWRQELAGVNIKYDLVKDIPAGAVMGALEDTYRIGEGDDDE